ncbi:GNAT family N-acetyltransferase [Micromonospora sp. WMMD754]|uniref:GNAT family N-acetyltransferase n=1 Tax=Micromonospora sp. WMMD754 TaxID=3404114 RepID=UPI003BF53DF5
MMSQRLRLATASDVDALVDILNGAVDWLKQRGSDQWSGPPWHSSEPLPGVEAQTTHVAEDAHRHIVGLMDISTVPDEDFWTAADGLSAALYVRHLAVDRSRNGRGIGAWMLKQADTMAARAGRRCLRLDAWKTNTALHRYYLAQGFEHLRTVEVPGRHSGALFQRLTTVEI